MEWYQDSFIVKFLNRRVVLKQFIKFAFVGVLNTLIDFIAYIFFTRVVGFHYLLAAVLAFVIAVTFSFLSNYYWTFKIESKVSALKYTKFFLVALVGLFLNMFFLYFFVDKLFWYDLWAKVLATIFVMNWNFWAQKYWTFKVK